jgi:hypothetical protein
VTGWKSYEANKYSLCEESINYGNIKTGVAYSNHGSLKG